MSPSGKGSGLWLRHREFESLHHNQKPINIGYLDFFPKGSYSNNYFLIEVNIKCIKIIDNLSLVIKFFRFLLFSYLPFLLRGCGSSLKAAIMGRYPVGGSGPVCKTGAYYARMVRAHLSPPNKYGRVAQLEERRKIIDFWEIVEQQFSNCFGSRMPKVRILPRPLMNFYSSFLLTIVKNASLLGGEVMLM